MLIELKSAVWMIIVFNVYFCLPVWKLEYFEAEIPEDHLVLWGKLYDEYRKDMSSALGESRSPAAVYEKYRKVVCELYFLIFVLMFCYRNPL